MTKYDDGIFRDFNINNFPDKFKTIKNEIFLQNNLNIDTDEKAIKFFLIIIKNFGKRMIYNLKYISKEMFKNHWLKPYIIPIWNNRNLDEVLLDLKLINKLPNDKEKGRVYRELFPTNKGESDKQQIVNLMKMFERSNKTNMEVFIKKCIDCL